ncbi:hypothetical protein, partial [uncultured Dialister sp.]|uniref:hypothetical protein n=1 Tax=uncultured Dialister sp. TaxID=278064 RepID=UPI00266EB44F
MGGKGERKQENRPGAREKRKPDNRCAGKTAEKQRYAFSLEKMGKEALSYQTFTTAPRCEWEHHTTKASPCGEGVRIFFWTILVVLTLSLS